MTREEMAAEAEAQYKRAYKPSGNAIFDQHIRLAYLLGFAQGGAYGVTLSNAAIQSANALNKISLEFK